MTSQSVLRLFLYFYIALFFTYLFGPLILMSITAFNSSEFPRVNPFECFTFEWFEKLAADTKLLEGIRSSFLIGLGVVCLSVPIGLAGAILLTQVRPKVRSIYYTIVISPILIPGVVLGISTVVFWDRLGTFFSADYDTVFYDGFFLTVVGQTTFISAYTMLVFIARLQRFDTAQEEAALDLGATQVQTFRKILLPFLQPAIFSAAVLAFLASFENYNTTVFTVISESTLTTVLASKVRYGIDPSISSLAVIIVGLTVLGAIAYELLRQREEAREAGAKKEGVSLSRARVATSLQNPASILILLVFLAGLGTSYMAVTTDTAQCKADVIEQRKLRNQIQQAPADFLRKKEQQAPVQAPTPASPGSGQFPGVFDPNNLQGTPAPTTPSPSKPAQSPFGGVFDPGNLAPQTSPAPEPQPIPEEATPKPQQFRGIFDPNNLAPGSAQ